MKLSVFIDGDGPEMREAKEKADEIIAGGYEVEILDWETDEAIETANLYDIYSAPAFVVSGPDGGLIERWQGLEVPLVSDIEHLM
jgi:hypothetical protein